MKISGEKKFYNVCGKYVLNFLNLSFARLEYLEKFSFKSYGCTMLPLFQCVPAILVSLTLLTVYRSLFNYFI